MFKQMVDIATTVLQRVKIEISIIYVSKQRHVRNICNNSLQIYHSLYYNIVCFLTISVFICRVPSIIGKACIPSSLCYNS
jgi:hypothetical protein